MHSVQKVITHFSVRFPNATTVREIPCSGILINMKIVAVLTAGYFIKYFDSIKADFFF